MSVICRLVSFGNVPAKVDDALVSTIQAQLQAQPIQQSHFALGEQLRIHRSFGGTPPSEPHLFLVAYGQN